MSSNFNHTIQLIEFIQCVVLPIAELLGCFLCNADYNFVRDSTRPESDMSYIRISTANSG